MPNRHSRTVGALLLVMVCLPGVVRADQPEDTASREIPPTLAPLEFLLGSWKGPGVLKNNPAERFRGWTETHAWAWVFAKGKPVALRVSIRGGKIVERATLTHDDNRDYYRLECKEAGAGGQTIVFEGNLDSSGKGLTLERKGKAGRERLTIRANSNYIRYILSVDDREEGAILYKPRIEVGLTKEGESFAAGSTVAARAVCIVTGSAASMPVTYKGQTYPVCCTGCRDEFYDNPEKYLQKLSLKAAETSTAGQQRPARVNRFEDAFAGDVPEAEAKPAAKMTEKQTSEAPNTTADGTPEKGAKDEKAKAKAPTATQLASRAATWLSMARNLEKSGKTAAALGYYRRIVKECPGTPPVKTANERIKALSRP